MELNKKEVIPMKAGILAGITAVMLLLCCTLPAAASDSTLGVFGNANEDAIIDVQDVEYTERIVLGFDEQTQLADAKYDDKVDILDVTQIELIILGREKELTIIDDTVTDMHPNGKPVTVKKPVEHIIALHSHVSESLRTLDSGDKVIGINKYNAGEEMFFPEISKLPVVGSVATPDAEKIFSLNPDLIVGYGSYFTKWTAYLEDNLDSTDITLVRLDLYKPETMSDDLRKLGYILNKNDEADEFIDFYEGYLNFINEPINGLSEDEKPRVYVEGFSDYKTYSEGAAANQMCVLAGGRNIAADLSGSYPKVDPEWVAEQNPDIIVKIVSSDVSSGYGEDDTSELKAVRDDIMNRIVLAEVNAVKNDQVYVISSIVSNPRYFIGFSYHVKWFHPDLFEDLDPRAIHQEYLTEYQGLDYDLNKHGVFVYPPLEEI